MYDKHILLEATKNVIVRLIKNVLSLAAFLVIITLFGYGIEAILGPIIGVPAAIGVGLVILFGIIMFILAVGEEAADLLLRKDK